MAPVWRALVETGFIIFLYYSNLMMGEFERSGEARTRGFLWALHDVLTVQNLAIAVCSALVGYVVVEYLRRRV
jgi:hypothetical protein